MKKKIVLILTYIIIFFNSNLLSNEGDKTLKIGLLAPLSGDYKELGESLLHSLQLALEEIADKDVFIIPRDSGFNNKEKLNAAIKDIKLQGVKIIIGPMTYEEFDEVKKYNKLTFVSPSNISPEFINNIISVGISLESQLLRLVDFIKKQNKKKNNNNVPKKSIHRINRKKNKKFKFKQYQNIYL